LGAALRGRRCSARSTRHSGIGDLTEFEALVFVDLSAIRVQFPDDRLATHIEGLRQAVGDALPEEIDEGELNGAWQAAC